MNKILYRKTTKADMKILMKLRLEMLREVNGLSGEYEYDENFIFESRRYFESGEQTTVIASDGETLVGCASLSYTWIMPTSLTHSHSTMYLLKRRLLIVLRHSVQIHIPPCIY